MKRLTPLLYFLVPQSAHIFTQQDEKQRDCEHYYEEMYVVNVCIHFKVNKICILSLFYEIRYQCG